MFRFDKTKEGFSSREKELEILYEAAQIPVEDNTPTKEVVDNETILKELNSVLDGTYKPGPDKTIENETLHETP